MYILHTELYLTYKSCTCSNWNFQDKKKENNVDGTNKSRSNKIELTAYLSALPTRRDVFSLTALPITIVGARNVVLCRHQKPCYTRIYIWVYGWDNFFISAHIYIYIYLICADKAEKRWKIQKFSGVLWHGGDFALNLFAQTKRTISMNINYRHK